MNPASTHNSKRLWKQKLCTLWNGWVIYVVNGTYVRDNYFDDWVEGGNFQADKFIPKGEIWLEELQDPVDLVESLVHEIIECMIMSYKLADKNDYDDAHDATNTVSRAVRKARAVGRVAIEKLRAQDTSEQMSTEHVAPKGNATMKELISQ